MVLHGVVFSLQRGSCSGGDWATTDERTLQQTQRPHGYLHTSTPQLQHLVLTSLHTAMPSTKLRTPSAHPSRTSHGSGRLPDQGRALPHLTNWRHMTIAGELLDAALGESSHVSTAQPRAAAQRRSPTATDSLFLLVTPKLPLPLLGQPHSICTLVTLAVSRHSQCCCGCMADAEGRALGQQGRWVMRH